MKKYSEATCFVGTSGSQCLPHRLLSTLDGEIHSHVATEATGGYHSDFARCKGCFSYPAFTLGALEQVQYLEHGVQGD